MVVGFYNWQLVLLKQIFGPSYFDRALDNSNF
jgi:hypothetical protein